MSASKKNWVIAASGARVDLALEPGHVGALAARLGVRVGVGADVDAVPTRLGQRGDQRGRRRESRRGGARRRRRRARSPRSATTSRAPSSRNASAAAIVSAREAPTQVRCPRDREPGLAPDRAQRLDRPLARRAPRAVGDRDVFGADGGQRAQRVLKTEGGKHAARAGTPRTRRRSWRRLRVGPRAGGRPGSLTRLAAPAKRPRRRVRPAGRGPTRAGAPSRRPSRGDGGPGESRGPPARRRSRGWPWVARRAPPAWHRPRGRLYARAAPRRRAAPPRGPHLGGRHEGQRQPQRHGQGRAARRALARQGLPRGREPPGRLEGAGRLRVQGRHRGAGHHQGGADGARGRTTAGSPRRGERRSPAPTPPGAGSSIPWTAPPTSCTACPTGPSRSPWSTRARSWPA